MGSDLLFTLITTFGIFFIGFIVYIHDKKSVSNLLFFLISFSTVCWALSNYVSISDSGPAALWAIRSVLFFAAPHVVLFYLFTLNFPNRELVIAKKKLWIILSALFSVMILTLTPLIFESVRFDTSGSIQPVPGKLIFIFAIFVLGSLILGMITMFKKYFHAAKEDKTKWGVMLMGVGLSYLLLIITNFIAVVAYENTHYTVYAPLFMLPSIIGMAYSVLRYKLLNVKTIATEILVFLVLSVSIVQIFFSTTITQTIINTSLFCLFLLFSLFLLKSVLKEVDQRERIQKLAEKLEGANEKLKSLDKLKTEFLSLASHQLRTPLTAIKGYTSMLLEGSFGEINDSQKEAVDRVFQSSQNLARVVEDLLDVSKIEQGGMQFQFSDTDIRPLIKSITDELSVAATNKGLTLNLQIPDQGDFKVSADELKLRQVLLNLIDNSIKYTRAGTIDAIVEEKGNYIRISIKDTGMGMTEETKSQLFQKFNRGEGGKVNTGGSGLGLYLAKEIVLAHKGKVWVESEGVEKGSTFIVELRKLSAPAV